MVNDGKKLAELATRLFTLPNLDRLAAAGTDRDGNNPLMSSPTSTAQWQASVKKEFWSEIDVLNPDSWMRFHVFGGGTTTFLGFCAIEYFSAATPVSFDLAQWDPSTDMLLSIATGASSKEMVERMYGIGDPQTLDQMVSGSVGPMIELARAFEHHNFIEQLEQTARSRNRSRLTLHVMGDGKRYQQLTKGLGFETLKTSDGVQFLKTLS